MSETLSPNTKAILLLTAPLIVGHGKGYEQANLLTPGEYTKLAVYLRETGREPADLLGSDTDQLFEDCHPIVDQDRLKRLLGRGFLLSQAVERWQARAIWVLSRADDAYPRKLKARLKKDSPSLLYGCGDREILDSGRIGGCRITQRERLVGRIYLRDLGVLAAKARRTVVSGAARGIDQAAMSAALESGGKVTGVLADSLERTVMNREHRNLLLDGRLALISPYDPNAGFNTGHAMRRNKVIYALADAALVVNSDINKGGTWAGAKEQLGKLHLVPVYVRSTGEGSKGLDALRNMGAMPWPNPVDTDDLDVVFQADTPTTPNEPTQSDLPFDVGQQSMKPELQPRVTLESQTADNPTPGPGEELYQMMRSLVTRLLMEPKKAVEVARELEVTQRQAEEWLKRLVAEGVLAKRSRPARSYVVRQAPVSD